MFLDLARTTGWCEGVPGERPTSGTIRLAPADASPGHVYAGMIQFLAPRLQSFRYRAICYEAPFDPRHMKTNFNTARLLLSLPSIAEGVCILTGHHTIREVSVNDVRSFLLGNRPAKGEAKQAIIDRLRGLGYDPKDDNEADAIAGWHFACSILAPATATDITPLLARKG